MISDNYMAGRRGFRIVVGITALVLLVGSNAASSSVSCFNEYCQYDNNLISLYINPNAYVNESTVVAVAYWNLTTGLIPISGANLTIEISRYIDGTPSYYELIKKENVTTNSKGYASFSFVPNYTGRYYVKANAGGNIQINNYFDAQSYVTFYKPRDLNLGMNTTIKNTLMKPRSLEAVTDNVSLQIGNIRREISPQQGTITYEHTVTDYNYTPILVNNSEVGYISVNPTKIYGEVILSNKTANQTRSLLRAFYINNTPFSGNFMAIIYNQSSEIANTTVRTNNHGIAEFDVNVHLPVGWVYMNIEYNGTVIDGVRIKSPEATQLSGGPALELSVSGPNITNSFDFISNGYGNRVYYGESYTVNARLYNRDSGIGYYGKKVYLYISNESDFLELTTGVDGWVNLTFTAPSELREKYIHWSSVKSFPINTDSF